MGDVKVTQADRERAAAFASYAWHLFRPDDYERAMQDAKDMRAGRSDDWCIVQAFARHRIAAMEEAARVADKMWLTDPQNIAAAIRGIDQ